MGELQPAARDPGVVLAFQGEGRGLGQKIAGLGDAAGLMEGLARHDDGLGAGEALDQPAIDEELVRAPPARLGRGGQGQSLMG